MKAGYGGRTTAQQPLSRRLGRVARAAGCALFVLAAVPVGNAAAEGAAAISAADSDGYGRMIITFEKHVPKYEVSTSTGVLVIKFDAPQAPDVTRLNEALGRYINAARRDPDGRAIRLALSRPVTINTMEAGEKLFVDLLPMGWVGLPPGLPQDVVAELARRAEEIEKRRREQEALEQFRNSEPVEVRITSLPTFTRFVFVWDKLPDVHLDKEVDKVRISFDRPAKIQLAGLESRFPPYVTAAGSRLGENGLEVYLSVDPEAPVRGFVEESNYVVDVTAPERASAGAAALDSKSEEAIVGAEDMPIVAVPPGGPGVGHPRPAALHDTEAEAQVHDPVASRATAAEPVPGGTDGAAAPPAGVADAVPVRPEARHFGTSVRITIPFLEPTAAAVFEYAGALWAVFETPQPVDARLLRHDLSGIVSAVDTWRGNDVTVMRMTLVKPLLTTVGGEPKSWIITLGDALLEPGQPLVPERTPDENQETEVVVDFPSAQSVHLVTDQGGSDRFYVVTAMPPARAVPKPYSMVDFNLPKTVHGLVVNPLTDGLKVDLKAGTVHISRDRGLNVSQINGSYTPGRSDSADAVRPGFVDYFDDTALDPGAVYRLLARHVRETAAASDEQRTNARVGMARALLGTDLGAEALAQLNLIEQEDPAALRDPSIRALRGIADVMMHRPDEAIREFDSFGLNQSSDVSLWRGLAEVERGNWRAAQGALKIGEPALSTYSPVRQHQFGMAAARAALESNDIADAAVRLAELGEATDTAHPDPELKLLNARLMAALGQTDAAVAAFDDVIGGSDRRLAAEAELRRAELTRGGYKGETVENTIENLERLAIAWRGDEIELGALRLLANLHAQQGNYARAFEIMKSATVANADSPTTRGLQDDMNMVFEGLFLGGQADKMPPVDALSLYYDFRELTPIGHKGDEIIRHLADRMVEVDLLQQASDLLRHQVDHRLKGAERAEVAAKLAWIYLMNHKPAEAIVVLSRTRQAVLPREVAYQRLLLEARALSETGRTELALDLLSSASGPEIDEVRAEVLWKGERWQQAGEAFENSLKDVWGSPDALTDTQRALVLRGAISYALANDQLGLQRFRDKFLAKMAESPDAHAFDVVSLPVPGSGEEFNKFVKEIAAVDSLDAFLEEYKQRYVLPKKGSDKLASQS